jgi:hypothetical protein
MRTLSAAELLDVWERGFIQPPAERALTLLSAACSDVSRESLASLSIGERDAQLLTLREQTFGPQLLLLATCRECGAKLETSFTTARLRVEPEEVATESFTLTKNGYELVFRLPNSFDLMAVTDCREFGAGHELLLDRCVSSVRFNSQKVSVSQLPDEIVDAFAERLSQLDPQGDVKLTLVCPQCDHEWQSIFDIEAFLWKEISAWAIRILREVHVLASAYGWREFDVLNMGRRRRQAYLELLSG